MRSLLALTGKKYLSQFKPKEIIDSYWEVEQKVEQLAAMIKHSKYPIIFTGAGISTSLGIPDYRSGAETIIKTGPGLWNRNQTHSAPPEVPIDKLVDLASPSLSHMFISTLLRLGIVKHLISQNTDGLHLKSGVPYDKISELHGNRNLQFCISCNRRYSRDFRTLRRDGKKYYPGEKRDHLTGRLCENCGGELHDSIIYFGQKLPSSELQSAYWHANQADLCISIGSSLTVKPSGSIPPFVVHKKQTGKLCIINIQETPIDHLAALRVNYFCDDVMELLAKDLGVKIDDLVVQHFLKVAVKREGEEVSLQIQGKDWNDNNLSFMQAVTMNSDGKEAEIAIAGHKCTVKLAHQAQVLNIYHFGEKPPLSLKLSSLPLQTNQFHLSYELQHGNWKVTMHQ